MPDTDVAAVVPHASTRYLAAHLRSRQVVMLIITFAILTFRLLLTVGASADYEEYGT